MQPRLYRIVVPVADIEQAVRFYRRVLDMEGRRVSAGRHYFDCGGTILACFDPRTDGDDHEPKPLPDHIYLSVPDLERVYLRAREAGDDLVEDSIQARPWGEVSFYMKDPFGNPLCFVDEATCFTGEG